MKFSPWMSYIGGENNVINVGVSTLGGYFTDCIQLGGFISHVSTTFLDIANKKLVHCVKEELKRSHAMYAEQANHAKSFISLRALPQKAGYLDISDYSLHISG